MSAPELPKITYTVNLTTAKEVITLLEYFKENSSNPNNARTVEKGRKSERTDARVDRFKGMPVSTLRQVLDLLAAQYKDGEIIPYGAGKKLAASLGYGRTTLQLALLYAIEKGQMRRLSQGRYCFGSAAKYSAQPDSIIDLVASDATRLLSALRVMSKVSDLVSFYISSEGISCRFTNRQKTAMLEARIARAAFSVYHVKGGKGQHVRLTISSRQLVRVLEKRQTNHFHLRVKEEGEHIEAGDIGNEHNLLVIGCDAQAAPYEAEMPLNSTQKMPASIMLSRELFENILDNVYARTDDVEVTCRPPGFASFETTPVIGYSKELTHSVECAEEIHSTYEVKRLLPFVNSRVIKSDTLVLKLNRFGMILQLMNEGGFLLNYHVTPKLTRQASPPVSPKRTAAIRGIEERMTTMENKMHMNDSDPSKAP